MRTSDDLSSAVHGGESHCGSVGAGRNRPSSTGANRGLRCVGIRPGGSLIEAETGSTLK